MKDKFLMFSVKMQTLMDDNGQDLIEYALVVALIAFGATATMQTLAGSISTAFTTINTKLITAVPS